MFRNSLLGLLIAAALSLCLSFEAQGQAPQWDRVFYVNPAATNAWPGGNGQTWNNAFADLVVAIAEAPGIADPGDIIRLNVAGGNYFGKTFVIHLNFPINHTGGFAIPDRMLIYGGYAGVGADPDERDPTAFTTTLVGLDLTIFGACGSTTAGDCFEDNSPDAGCDDADCCAAVCIREPICCTMEWDSGCAILADLICMGDPTKPIESRVDSVVATVGTGVTRRLDGLTITGGGNRKNLHVGAGQAAGGGIYITSQDLLDHARLDIVRCVIVDNWAADGGGIALFGDWSTQNPQCEGEGPDAGARIWNCEIIENRAGAWGGGVFARYQAPYQIVNSVIARNELFATNPATPAKLGAAVTDAVSGVEDVERLIVNCTITRNVGAPGAVSQGAGLIDLCFEQTTHELLIVNTVIRNNLIPVYDEEDVLIGYVECDQVSEDDCESDAPRGATLRYCNLHLPPSIPSTWTDCIDVDPGFVEIDHDPGLMIANYRLRPDSLMVDAGTPIGDEPVQILTDLIDVNDDGSDTDPNLDLDLRFRRQASVVSGCPRVDIGAYELETVDDCLVGDLNEDCTVDGADLGILLNSWGTCGAPCPADLNGDGEVDGADLGMLLNGWSGCDPLTYPRDCCPEPESLLGGGESESSESSGLTAAELADFLGFPSVAAMVDWLIEQPFGEMAVYLSLLG